MSVDRSKLLEILNRGPQIPQAALGVMNAIRKEATRSVRSATMAAMLAPERSSGAIYIGANCVAAALMPLAYALTAPENRTPEKKMRESITRDMMLFAALFSAFTESETSEGDRAMLNEAHEAAAILQGGGSGPDVPNTGLDKAHEAFKLLRGYDFKAAIVK